MRLLLLLFISFFVQSLPVLSQEQSGDREYWVERYLSVSFPLQNIHVTSPYGSRKNPFTGKPSHHSGLDLRANYESVMSMFDGVVESIGSDARSGRYVILRHGDYTISYCHLSKVLVDEEDEVFASDIVAITGNTGNTTGPHLHITCKYKGERIDPYKVLQRIQKVRVEAIQALGGEIRPKVWLSQNPSNLSRRDRENFLARYSELAIEHQKRYGIPASVTLAQMAYESFWGTSKLAREGKNYFGIKCSKQWLASGKPYSLHTDNKPNEKFCNYNSVEESIAHHSAVLMGERYKACHQYASTDYHNWLLNIIKCGYASAPDYVSTCEKIIKQYKLYLYDRLG